MTTEKRFVGEDCDEPFLKQTSLEAFCMIADMTSVQIIVHDQTATDALPQTPLARTFDSVSTPQYGTPVTMACVWDQDPRIEDLKRHGVTVNKGEKHVKLMFNNCLLEEAEITLHHNDRVQITGVGLCEIISLHSDRDMSTLQFNTEVIAYLVD